MQPTRPSRWEYAEFPANDMEAHWLAGWEFIGTRQRRGKKTVLMRRVKSVDSAGSALSDPQPG